MEPEHDGRARVNVYAVRYHTKETLLSQKTVPFISSIRLKNTFLPASPTSESGTTPDKCRPPYPGTPVQTKNGFSHPALPYRSGAPSSVHTVPPAASSTA